MTTPESLRGAICCVNIGGVEPLGDVLGAIRVPDGDRKENRLLGPRFVPLGHEHRHQLAVAFHDARLAPDLDAPALRIVDQEEIRLGTVAEVALGDVLAVAGEIREGDRPIVEHPQKAGRAATVLDVGLALLVGSGDEDARLRHDEFFKIGRDARSPRTLLFHSRIGPARTSKCLHCFDSGRKGDVARVALGRAHNDPLRSRVCSRRDDRPGGDPATSGTCNRPP